MQCLKRATFLHRCAYEGLCRGSVESKTLSHILDDLSPHRCSRDSHTFFTMDHFTIAKSSLFQGIRVNPQLKYSRDMSLVATTASTRMTSGDVAPSVSHPALPKNGIFSVLCSYGGCYWELFKARLSMLVISTTAAGYIMGSGPSVDLYGLSCTCLGTFFLAAGANTINQVLEVENDARMKRTCWRPLPSGRISLEHAVVLAAATSISGIALLTSQVNCVAAGLGAINLALYTLVYTPLKKIHPINTSIGAAVGAIPPLLGWAGAVGEVSLGGWVLASFLYFWQIPHFMAIAHLYRQDYAAAQFKMLLTEDVSGRMTALAALQNCSYLMPLGYAAYRCGLTTEWFGVETAAISAMMGVTAALFYHKPSTEGARKLFRASLLYLPVLLAAMVFHRHPNKNAAKSFTATHRRDSTNVNILQDLEKRDQT